MFNEVLFRVNQNIEHNILTKEKNVLIIRKFNNLIIYYFGDGIHDTQLNQTIHSNKLYKYNF